MIGVFDSGVGGLSVVRHLRNLAPDCDLLYVADRSRAPYGDRTLAEVAGYAAEITEWLIDRGADTIVIACNTASAAGLHDLRAAHPEIMFVGMEPAVKPAVGLSRRGVVGVLATAATFQGRLFSSVVDRFASGVDVITQPCLGWVELVESGTTQGPEAEAAVKRQLQPVLDAGADTLVLACTHYPFLAPLIEQLAGEEVAIIDPAEAVARQAVRVSTCETGSGRLEMVVNGPADGLADLVTRLTGLETSPQPVSFADGPAEW